MKKVASATLLVLSLLQASQAQNSPFCGADELRMQSLETHERLARAVSQRQQQLDAFTATFKENERGGGQQIYTIPVVFHVIHKYAAENISAEQIEDGLQVLNETFRKQRADTASIVEAFKPIHADCGIGFRLARRDPDGNCHSGINRIASPLGIAGGHDVKQLVHWDPTRYLNIYVVTNAAGLAGHAVWPADADTVPEWDGIVISNDYVGSIGTSDPTRSVVLAHECGHYLNLHHIWGGNNVPGFYYLPVAQSDNCNYDDLVDDTPNTIGWQSCNLGGASCGSTLDNVQNAMDYSYCNIMFTQGQRDRMRACLNSPIAGRNNLWQPANLLAAGIEPTLEQLCEADLISDKRVLCPTGNEQVTFTNTSYHGPFAGLNWTFDGGNAATSTADAPVVTFAQPGRHDVSLSVTDGNGNTVQVEKPDHITVLGTDASPFPFAESFEQLTAFDGPDWFDFSKDAENRFEVTALAAVSGTKSALVDGWGTASYNVDELYGPPIDLSGATQMQVSFKWAYTAQAEGTGIDILLFQVRKDCNANWTTRWSKSSDNVFTAPVQTAPFVPTPDQWQQAVVNIPSTYFSSDLRLRFVHSSKGQGRLFLDDINMDVNAGINEADGVFRSVSLSPLPTDEAAVLRFECLYAGAGQLELLDLTGRQIATPLPFSISSGANSVNIPTHQFPSGMYVVRMISAKGLCSLPLVVQHP